MAPGPLKTQDEEGRRGAPPWPEALGALFDEMEALKTPEAKLYKALDRMEAIQSHNESAVETWLPAAFTN